MCESIDVLLLHNVDLVRVYFHATTETEVHFGLPGDAREKGVCGLLRKAIYGTRHAVQNWEMECKEMLTGGGSAQEAYSTCMSYREQKDSRVVTHRGDFAVLDAQAFGSGQVRNTVEDGGEVRRTIGARKAGSGLDNYRAES